MKMKKWIAMAAAAAMLALSGPALAASPDEMVEQAYKNGRQVTTTIAMERGGYPLDESTDAVLTDLFSAMKLETITQQSGEDMAAQFAVYFDDRDALNFSCMTKSGEVYLSSNLLGDQLLAFTPQDLAGLFLRLANNMYEVDSGLSDKEKEEFLAQAEEDAAQMMELLSGGAEVLENEESLSIKEMFLEIYSNDQVLPIIEEVMKKAVVTSGNFQADGHDPAVLRLELTLTPQEQISLTKAVFEAFLQNERVMSFMRASTGDQLTYNGKAMTFEEATKALIQDLFGELEKMAGDMEDLPMTCLYNEAGEAVYATALISLRGLQSNISKPEASMDFPFTKGVYTYHRLTGEDGIAHSELIDYSNDDHSNKMTMRVNYLEGGQKRSEASFVMEITEDGEAEVQMELSFQSDKDYGEEKATDSSVFTAAVTEDGETTGVVLTVERQAQYNGTDATRIVRADLALAGEKEPILSLQADTITSQGTDLALPDGAKTVRLGNMTDDELSQWGQEAAEQLVEGIQYLLLSLPSSVLSPMMGM